jgi:hypothetical protein
MITFTATQIVLHLIGDYVTQSNWMATQKLKRTIPALVHAVIYAIPFIPLCSTRWSYLFILWSHFFIDRYRLARYVVWAKNHLAPRWTVEHAPPGLGPGRYLEPIKYQWWQPWSECDRTGYHHSMPPHLADWLLIITDNVLHLICNAFALSYL